MIRRVQEIVENIPTVILAGNHDQCSDASGDNALAPLYPVSEVIDSPDIVSIGVVDLIMVPYLSGDYTKRLEDSIDDLISPDPSRRGNRHQILCFHAGIIDEKTPKFLAESSSAIAKEYLFELCGKYNITGALAGHWHTRRQWDLNDNSFVIQAGALAPTGFGDMGTDYGSLFIYDSDTMYDSDTKGYSSHVVPGPRFLDVTLDQDITTISASRSNILTGCDLYIRISVDETEIALGETIIKAGIDAGVISNGELSINKERSKEACKKAAMATKSSATLEEALSAYTSNMPVKGVDDLDLPEARLEILTSALEYLRKSGAD
jgi:DNA repair exonuclease SbcCD nuclease subunit